jgi:hypothetical protein
MNMTTVQLLTQFLDPGSVCLCSEKRTEFAAVPDLSVASTARIKYCHWLCVLCLKGSYLIVRVMF